ncbi:unnamed protein product [Absidia cylindrospora]
MFHGRAKRKEQVDFGSRSFGTTMEHVVIGVRQFKSRYVEWRTCQKGKQNIMNNKRSLDGVSSKDRTKCGAKVDILYRRGSMKLGCVEAGREQGMNQSTKEFKNKY